VIEEPGELGPAQARNVGASPGERGSARVRRLRCVAVHHDAFTRIRAHGLCRRHQVRGESCSDRNVMTIHFPRRRMTK
jgi:hypothetical protein